MQTRILKLENAKTDSAKIRQAAETLDNGGLVAFPTETVYGLACRVDADSIAKLDQVKGRKPEKHYTLHIGSKDDVKKYLPRIGLRMQKLIENAWPGPLTIVADLSDEDISKLTGTLGQETVQYLYKNNSIGIRCPEHQIASELLQLAQSPIVAPSANLAGHKPAVNAEEVLEQLSGKIDVLLDGGPCKYQRSSTVVKIGSKGLEILRPGVFQQEQIEKFLEVTFLFVCTGNTCRSPMAKGIFKKYLAEKLDCDVDQLETKGYKIVSAGTMGMAGLPPSPESVVACAAKGIDIEGHKSMALSEELVRGSDFIFGMARMHCERVVVMYPEAANRCALLAGEREVPDPIGQIQQVYNSCADLIEDSVKWIVGRLKI